MEIDALNNTIPFKTPQRRVNSFPKLMRTKTSRIICITPITPTMTSPTAMLTTRILVKFCSFLVLSTIAHTNTFPAMLAMNIMAKRMHRIISAAWDKGITWWKLSASHLCKIRQSTGSTACLCPVYIFPIRWNSLNYVCTVHSWRNVS